MKTVDPLWFGVECIRWFYVTEKPEKQSSNTFTEEETAAVRRVLVERIKSSSADGALLFDPDVQQECSTLYEWWRAEGRDPVQVHLVNVFTKDPKQITRFLQSQAPLGWSEGDAMPHVGELASDQLKNIELIIDLDTMAELVRNHCHGDFDNPQWLPDDTRELEERLAEQFMFVFKMEEGERSRPTSVRNVGKRWHDAGDTACVGARIPCPRPESKDRILEATVPNTSVPHSRPPDLRGGSRCLTLHQKT